MVIENKEEPRVARLSRQSKNTFSMTINFSSWLTKQKTVWKQRVKGNDNKSSQQFDVVRHQELKSIIQIVPQKIPGMFNVWYHSGGKIQQLLVSIKRRYYAKDKQGTKKAPHDQGEAKQVIIDE